MLGIKSEKNNRLIHITTQDVFLIGPSLARIAFGIIILYFYLIHYAQRHYIWSAEGVLNTFELGISFSLYQYSESLIYFDLIYHLGIIFTILFTIGYKTRLISIIHFVFYWSIVSISTHLLDGGDNILRILLFYLLFANISAYFSVDRMLAEKQNKPVKTTLFTPIGKILHNFAVVLSIIQLCLMYLASGLYQVMGSMWHNGTAIYYILQVEQFSNPTYRNLFLPYDTLIVIFTYASIIVKLAFPFLLFNRVTKAIAVATVVMFHLGIGVVMGLYTFSLVMISIDLLLLTDKDYFRLRSITQTMLRRWRLGLQWRVRLFARKRALTNLKLVVFYDGWCPLCQQIKQRVKKLDWLNLIRFASFRERETLLNYKLDHEKAEERMLSTNKKELYEGIDSFIQMSKRVLPMWPVYPVLIIAKLIGLGQFAYDFIAKRRTIIPTGACDDECVVDGKVGGRS